MNPKWGWWNLAIGAGLVLGGKYLLLASFLLLPSDPRGGDDPGFLVLAALVGAFVVIPYMVADWRKRQAEEGYLVWIGYAAAWVIFLLYTLSSPNGALELHKVAKVIVSLVLDYVGGWLVFGALLLGFWAFVFAGAFVERANEALNRGLHNLWMKTVRATGRFCGRVYRSIIGRSS